MSASASASSLSLSMELESSKVPAAEAPGSPYGREGANIPSREAASRNPRIASNTSIAAIPLARIASIAIIIIMTLTLQQEYAPINKVQADSYQLSDHKELGPMNADKLVEVASSRHEQQEQHSSPDNMMEQTTARPTRRPKLTATSDESSPSGPRQADRNDLASSRASAPNLQEMKAPTGKSCYVCSTMDYENPANNYCRFMKRLQQQQQQQILSSAPSSSYDPHHNRLSLAQRKKNHQETAESGNGSGNSEENGQMAGGHSRQHNQISDPTQYSSSTSGSHLDSYDETGLATASPVYSPSDNSTALATGYSNLTAGEIEPQFGGIRTRLCHDDENFCSVVSVVRIEYVNNELQSRFWALERNCSKSCNTGCMLIGEIVRLRVCSICCRKPNCNVGGASNSIHDRMRFNKDSMLSFGQLPIVMMITFFMFAFNSVQVLTINPK